MCALRSARSIFGQLCATAARRAPTARAIRRVLSHGPPLLRLAWSDLQVRWFTTPVTRRPAASSGTSAVPVVDRLEPPDRSRGRPVVAAGRADAEAALDVLDEPTPAVSVPAPEWQPSRDVPIDMRRVLPVHLPAVPMRLPAVATIPVAMVAVPVPVRVPGVATAPLLALRVAVDVAVPVDLVAVPAPCPGTLCVATGPVSVVAVTPHHRCVPRGPSDPFRPPGSGEPRVRPPGTRRWGARQRAAGP